MSLDADESALMQLSYSSLLFPRPVLQRRGEVGGLDGFVAGQVGDGVGVRAVAVVAAGTGVLGGDEGREAAKKLAGKVMAPGSFCLAREVETSRGLPWRGWRSTSMRASAKRGPNSGSSSRKGRQNSYAPENYLRPI